MKETTTKKINMIAKDLFPSVKQDDILHWENKRLMYKGQPISRETLTSLSAQAKAIKSFDLYKVLTDEMKFLAQKKIFDEVETIEDLKSARWILWTLDVLEKKIDKISQM